MSPAEAAYSAWSTATYGAGIVIWHNLRADQQDAWKDAVEAAGQEVGRDELEEARAERDSGLETLSDLEEAVRGLLVELTPDCQIPVRRHCA